MNLEHICTRSVYTCLLSGLLESCASNFLLAKVMGKIYPAGVWRKIADLRSICDGKILPVGGYDSGSATMAIFMHIIQVPTPGKSLVTWHLHGL